MESKENTKIWKIRMVKNYPEAHNHLLVGKVVDITDTYIRLHCRTYHFGRVINRPQDIQIGNLMLRVVPWSRVEVINELPPTFDYIRSTIVADKEGQMIFQDNLHSCHIGSGTKHEVRY